MFNPRPFEDAAAPLLSAEPSLTDAQRSDAWEAYHLSDSHIDLANRLAPMVIPSQLKQQLTDARQQQLKPIEPVDRVVAALEKLKDIHPDALDAAEKPRTS